MDNANTEWEMFMSESKPANAANAAPAVVWDDFQASPPVWTSSHVSCKAMFINNTIITPKLA